MPRRPKNDASSSGDTSSLVRWSTKEIRRIVIKLAQRSIQPAQIIAWSPWRRAYQAEVRRAYLKNTLQLQCWAATSSTLFKLYHYPFLTPLYQAAQIGQDYNNVRPHSAIGERTPVIMFTINRNIPMGSTVPEALN